MADIMRIEEMPLLLRREVEARILKPFLEAMEKELGRERTIEIVKEIIGAEAREHGRVQAEEYGGNKLEDVPGISGHHAEGGSLKLSIEYPAPNQLMMRTLECEYCQMYKRLGMGDWGYYLSCHRDDEFMKGINPNFRMERTQVLMHGGSCCDTLIIDTKGEN